MSNKLTDKERSIIAACRFSPRYSGEESEKFWREVNNPANDRVLYDFACALQDLEHRVLTAVNAGVEVRAEKTIRTMRARRAAKR
jgi:hypothetical protein